VLEFSFYVVERQRQARERRERAHEPARLHLWSRLVRQEAECAQHATPRLGPGEQRMTRCQEVIELQAAVHPSCQRATWHPRNGVNV
jgi:hypothetical protein